MTTLFVSDLHLDPERPAITELFGRFLDGEARDADALYILGDLFEAWVGDDDPSEAGTFVAARLKALADAGQWDAAKGTLAWVADKAFDEGYMALARLRLAGVLMEQKAYDEALAQLSGRMPAEFAGVAADRKGDVLALQGKNQEAIAEYRRAYQAFGDGVEYRRLVEAKLNALGAQAQTVAAAAATAGGAQ